MRDVSKCQKFEETFYGCSNLSDIKPLENWNVSKCTKLNHMFDLYLSLSDIKALEK